MPLAPCLRRSAACARASAAAVVLGVSPSAPFARPGSPPLASASLLSRLYFVWVSPLIAALAGAGFADGRPPSALAMSDLWLLRDEESSAGAAALVSNAWVAERGAARAARRAPSFARALLRAVWSDMVLVFVLKMGWLLFSMISNALLLRAVLAYFRDSSATAAGGAALVAAYVAAETGRSLCVNQHWLTAVLAGARLRSGVRALVYAKAMSRGPGGGGGSGGSSGGGGGGGSGAEALTGARVSGFRQLPGCLHDPALARAYSVDWRPGLVVVSFPTCPGAAWHKCLPGFQQP